MASNAAQQLQDNQSYRHHLIWLDENMNKFYNKQSLKQLREIDSEIKSFVCQEECIDYVRQQDDRNSTSYIIFIVSGSLSKNTIPRIEDYTCIHTIFIFCTNIDRYADIQSPKLRAILNDPNELMDSIQMCIARDNTVTSFSCFSDQHSSRGGKLLIEKKINKYLFLYYVESISSKEQYPIRNLKEDQARFIWHYHMHDFMVTMEDNDDENARENLFDRCREHYRDKPLMLLKIEEFQQECQRDNDENALHWYTKNSFVYDCLNTVLRQENISQVYSYRYIIKLLCRQLTEQHKKFIKKYKKKEKTSLRLYRGVHLKPDEIDFLTRNTNNLIAFNGFVSTTKKQDIAEQFIQHRWKEGCKPVLIIIKIDMTTEYSVAFADISKFSKYPEEAEVLLSIGSVFRVESVDFDEEDELHIVRLSLCQHNQLTVINYIEQTYAKNVDTADKSVLFGKLLFDMGECETAATYFKDALERLTDNNNQLRANYLNNLGVCYNEMGEKDEALKYYKGALKLYEQANNKRGIGACQHNVSISSECLFVLHFLILFYYR
jgi:tetratricopeptide (TPR) repeat protein